MDALFRVEMLGRFRVLQDSREITRFRTQKTAALLAYLALYRSRSHPREVLIERFWPDSTLEAARSNLSVALNALRRQLEPPGVPAGAVVIANHAQVRLNPMAFTTDVDDFEQALGTAQLETDAERRVNSWRRSVDQYAGDLMPGFYEEWVLAERERLRDAYRGALRQVVKEYAETRQFEEAILYAHRMAQADPLREESVRNLMRLYVAVGRPADALYQYQELERLLQQELQVAPSSATRELAEQLRDTDLKRRTTGEARAADSPPKDPAGVPQAPMPDRQRPPLRLPLQFTRYFGREAEIAHLVDALILPPEVLTSEPSTPYGQHSRLLTLTGPGGTGKTRLSIEVAGRVKESFPGGIWFVPLAELVDHRLLGETLRDTLGLPRQTQGPALDQVSTFLKEREGTSLLILDNFEQITAGGAPVVWTLMNRVGALRCLVTSRQPLSLPGEQEIPVSPLPTPVWEPQAPPETLLPTHLLGYASVALFVDRAQAARPEFQITPRNAEAIAAICEKLEGLPLALELAAARAKALTPAQILERLSARFELLASRQTDKGERHRSLWAAIDWSYHLLSPGLQRLFARLSVFRGGWSLEAAQAVCQETGALEYLSQLRSHSLILAEESSAEIRFGMLEAIREFAAEQLESEEREGTERHHAEFFRQIVTGGPLESFEQAAQFQRFEEDLDNLRAVLAWSLEERHDLSIGLHTAGELHLFWQVRGHLSEGRRWYTRLLERAGETPTLELCRSLYGAGALASLQGDFQAAHPLLERCKEVARALENEAILLDAYNEMGTMAYRQGDYTQARAQYEKSLALARAQESQKGVAGALGNLANVAQSAGDFSPSQTLNEESLEIWREIGDRYGEARTLHNLGNLAHSQGEFAEARAYYGQSLEITRVLGDRFSISYSLLNIALVEIDQTNYADAAAYARESLALARELNARMNLVDILEVLIGLVREIGELEIAARMYGALERIREEMNFPLAWLDLEEYERLQTALRDSLGTAIYEAAKTEGRALSLEQALACLEETLASKSL